MPVVTHAGIGDYADNASRLKAGGDSQQRVLGLTVNPWEAVSQRRACSPVGLMPGAAFVCPPGNIRLSTVWKTPFFLFFFAREGVPVEGGGI